METMKYGNSKNLKYILNNLFSLRNKLQKMDQNIVVDPERPINTIIFSMEMTNPYVFRQIFELYDKFIIQAVPMFFKESGITLRTGTNNNKNNRRLISDVEIYTDDIVEYYLNEDLATVPRTENSEACHIEQFNINMIRSIFKSISKTTNLRVYKTTMHEDIFIDIKGLTTEHLRLASSRYQSVEYDFSEFENISSVPNIKIEISQFCNNMKSMTRGDSDYTSFKVFPEGLVVEGRNNNGSVMRDTKWGKVNKDYDESEYVETKVNSSLIKALSKINGMSMYGIVKIMSEQNGYLKLNHKIGDFGEHNIYLIDIS